MNTFPATDWTELKVHDMCSEPDEDYTSCELCGHAQVRYLHEMIHSNWRGPLMVGRLLGDYETPRKLQRKLTKKSGPC